MTWASSWSFNTRSRATSLTGKGLVGDDDLLRFRMPTEMLREIEQRTREARLHGQKIGSGNHFVRLPQPRGQYIDEIAVDLGVCAMHSSNVLRPTKRSSQSRMGTSNNTRFRRFLP